MDKYIGGFWFAILMIGFAIIVCSETMHPITTGMVTGGAFGTMLCLIDVIEKHR